MKLFFVWGVGGRAQQAYGYILLQIEKEIIASTQHLPGYLKLCFSLL
jgi:hypothetical protein